MVTKKTGADKKVEFDITPVKFHASIKAVTSLYAILVTLVLAVCLVSFVRCINLYFEKYDYYSVEYHNFNEFSTLFSSLNDNLEKYLKYDNSELLNEIKTTKERLVELCDEIEAGMAGEGEDYQYIAVSLVRNYENYQRRINELVNFEDKQDALYQYYTLIKPTGETIEKYTAQLLNHKMTEGMNFYNETKASVTRSRYIIGFSIVAILVLIILVYTYVIKRILEPISKICENAEYMASGNFELPDIEVDVDNEIGVLVGTFNFTKNNLKHLFETQQKNKEMELVIQDEKQKFANLSKSAETDNLTGLLVRNATDKRISKYMQNRLIAQEGTLFLIDFDHFKEINDSLSHQGGDAALKLLAETLREVFGKQAYIGRWGGDEFVAFATDVYVKESLEEIGKSLCEKMDMEFSFEGKQRRISVSVGIATTEKLDTIEQLYKNADIALYDVKNNGRNGYRIFDTNLERGDGDEI